MSKSACSPQGRKVLRAAVSVAMPRLMARPDSAGGSDVAGAASIAAGAFDSVASGADGAAGSGALEHPAIVSKTAQGESNIPRKTRMHASRHPTLGAKHI